MGRLRKKYPKNGGFAFVVRRETGKESRVKVSYGEGVANHTGLESCAVHREMYGEALTGEVQASH